MEEDNEDEELAAHRIASTRARLAAIRSVEQMKIPDAFPLPRDVTSLGPKISAEYRATLDRLSREPRCSKSIARYVAALALKLAWYGVLNGAHYVQFIKEEHPGEHSLGPYDEWYVDVTGLANGLADELGNLTPSEERQLLQTQSPLAESPTDRALYFGLSLVCFVEAQKYAAKGATSNAFDFLHEAHRALSLEHGLYMWEAATDELKNQLSDASQKQARTALARTAASARHAENRAMKQQVFEWCDAHMAHAPSMDTAASRVAGVFVPVAWRTVRDWMTEWKKLRSAGTA